MIPITPTPPARPPTRPLGLSCDDLGVCSNPWEPCTLQCRRQQAQTTAAASNCWLTNNTVPPGVDMARVHARAQQAQAARAQGLDDPKDQPDPYSDSIAADDAADTWLAIFGVVALVVVICGVAGYVWQRWGASAIDLLLRHAVTLGLPG